MTGSSPPGFHTFHATGRDCSLCGEPAGTILVTIDGSPVLFQAHEACLRDLVREIRNGLGLTPPEEPPIQTWPDTPPAEAKP